MATVYRCDGCRAETPATWTATPAGDGWVCVCVHDSQTPDLHFCGWSCLSRFATAQAFNQITEAGP